ncbi:MAG: phosphatase PAP2 family protein [Pirellulaceae bacterium]|nr:phosphatase PAP2 family protein [Pirellulaceae bacterium]
MSVHSSSIPPIRWQWIPLAGLHLLAAGLLLSYMLPQGHAWWRAIDEQIFFTLNGTLPNNYLWQLLWAWGNTRFHDAVVGAGILLCLLFPIAGFQRQHLQGALFRYIAMMLVLLFARIAFKEFCGATGLRGPSPSLVLQPVVRLSELVPFLPLKDASVDSFPGDHATILLAWAGFVLLFRRHWSSCLAAIVPALMVLPRIVVGAHWFSDVAVGGMCVALPVLAWTYYTPAVNYVAAWLHRLASPILQALANSPWLRRQHFFIHGPKFDRGMPLAS